MPFITDNPETRGYICMLYPRVSASIRDGLWLLVNCSLSTMRCNSPTRTCASIPGSPAPEHKLRRVLPGLLGTQHFARRTRHRAWPRRPILVESGIRRLVPRPRPSRIYRRHPVPSLCANVVVHPAVNEYRRRVDRGIRERMPWAAESHRIPGHVRLFLPEPAVHKQKSVRHRRYRARRRDVTIIRLAPSVARDDVAVVEHDAPSAEYEVHVAPDFALVEIRPA